MAMQMSEQPGPFGFGAILVSMTQTNFVFMYQYLNPFDSVLVCEIDTAS